MRRFSQPARRRNRFVPAINMFSTRDPIPRGSETLETRALLSNLAILDAFLIDGAGDRITSPILGQQLEVRTTFSTSGLTISDTYSIRVMVNGIEVDRTGITFGAGLPNGTWQVDMFHGFAETGNRTVQVILDPFNQLIEDNESDNTQTFTFEAVSATNFPQKLGPFVKGTAGVDWRITNFADLDPRPGVLRDYRGGQFTYDTATFGHDAIDLGPGRFSATDQGIGIYAAAAGIVQSINDGAYDRHTGFVNPAPAANYVTIDLGHGWQTRYWHLRRDSVSVKVGDVVQAGDFLGWMGSSGFSTGPHVHFEVVYKNHAVETMLDPATYWITPPTYPSDTRHAISSGFTSEAPTASEWNEGPEDIRTFLPGSRVYFWVIAGAMMPGDNRTIRFQRPDGSVFFEQTYDQGNVFYNASQWYYFVNLPLNAPLGTWTTIWLQNGIERARQSFTVSTTGVPEIRVEQGTQLIRDQRFTPIDFGSIAAGAPPPIQSFTITNQGSAPLTLGTISLPAGYALESSPSTTVPPGQTTTLSVRLQTTAAGYYSGELRMVTNDADESVFRIWLEGIVEVPGTATLIPGLSIRQAAEGSEFYANVRRTGSTASAVTVSLSTDVSELQVPANVTIPAGASFVNFKVQTVQDYAADGDQRVQLVASAAGMISGRNEILVKDAEPDAPRISAPVLAQPGSPVTISWTEVPMAVEYELWVNFRSGNINRIVHTAVTGTSFTISGFEDMGIYRAWVRATIATGMTTRWSHFHDIRIADRISLHAMPRFVDTATPVFSWNPVPTAVHYDLWVDEVFSGTSQLIRRTDITGTSFAVTSSLPMGLYRVWVRGIDHRGEASTWSIRQEFYIAPRPSMGLTPLSTFDRTPTLRWEAVQGARTYEIWLRDSFTGEDKYRVGDLHQREWTVPTDLTLGRFQWWVRAHGDYGVTGLWSFSRDIWVGGRPTQPTVQIHGNSSVSFGWSAVEGAFTYHLQVDRLDVPQVRVIREDLVFGSTYQTPGALAPGTYRVWIRAVSVSGEFSLWSRESDFTISQASEAVSEPLMPGLPKLAMKRLPGLNGGELRVVKSQTRTAAGSSEENRGFVQNDISQDQPEPQRLVAKAGQDASQLARFWAQENNGLGFWGRNLEDGGVQESL